MNRIYDLFEPCGIKDKIYDDYLITTCSIKNLEEAELELLCELLKINNKIIILSIYYTTFTHHMMNIFTDELRSMNNIKILRLFHCDISSNINAFANFLLDCHLDEMCFSMLSANEEQLKIICSSLACSGIKTFACVDNSSESSLLLCKVLSTYSYPHLQSLILSSNHMMPHHIHMLFRNHTIFSILNEFDVYDNDLSQGNDNNWDNHVKLNIYQNTFSKLEITKLTLSHCNLSNIDIELLFSNISMSLTHLDISYNCFDNYQPILTDMHDNISNLNSLLIQHNIIVNHIHQQLTDALFNNTKLIFINVGSDINVEYFMERNMWNTSIKQQSLLQLLCSS